MYCPPISITTLDHFSDYFLTLVHRFNSEGDFNAKNRVCGNWSPNIRVRTLLRCMNISNFSSGALPGETDWPSHNNKLTDILELFIKKLPSYIHKNLTHPYDLFSDHTSTLLKFGLNIPSLQ